ncbi:DUF982 domain-containing protein [Mesorhizobium sp. NPDC059054]|uniref:DUF982 domain-containing protein n=1 Tax=Mesorhizobium sp. NPDC059054 TaxID=3346711 RepID=UPI001379BDFB
MAPFTPVTFRTARGFELQVASLHQVVRAMAMAWPNKDCELYRTAARLAERAEQGWCTPRAAYDAFVAAAREQGRIVAPRKLHDRVLDEMAAIEPGNFNPPSSTTRQRSRRSIANTASRSRHA